MTTYLFTPKPQSIIGRIRRHHALEHATLHVLSESLPRRNLAGYSDWRGFWIIGELTLEQVYEAVNTALTRLKNGESGLAVHPNCGTNFVTSGLIAGAGAFLASLGTGKRRRDWLERLPMAASLATLGLIVAQPLGFFIQEHVTTSPEMGDLQVVEITASRRGRMPAFRILTRG